MKERDLPPVSQGCMSSVITASRLDSLFLLQLLMGETLGLEDVIPDSIPAPGQLDKILPVTS